MRRWAFVIVSIALCGGCDYVFRLDRVPAAADQPPAVVKGGGATDDCATCDKVTLDVTVEPARAHTLLLVSVSASASGTTAAPAVTSVVLGKASFALVARASPTDGSKPAIEQWVLVDPPVGAGSIEVMLAAKVDALVAGVVEIEGASDDPLGSSHGTGSTASGKAADNEVDSAELDLVIDTLCAGTSIDAPGAGQDKLFIRNVTAAQTCGNLGSSSGPGAPTVSVHWDINAASPDHWVDIATSIHPSI